MTSQMLKSRRAQWVFTVFTLLSLVVTLQEAEAARRRRSRFISLADPRLSFLLTAKSRLFGRSFINELLIAPVNLPFAAQTGFYPRNQSFDPRHFDSRHGISANQVLGVRPVVVDLQGQPTEFTQDDQGLPLSEFCRLNCGGSVSASRVLCWVPRDGSLAIVPFSTSGPSLCHARQSLCLQIEGVGRVVDRQPFVCKDTTSNAILVRSEPTFEDTDGAVVVDQRSRCRSGRCGQR